MKPTRVLLAVICTALFCSESFGQGMYFPTVVIQGPTVTNTIDTTNDLVEAKLDYAQRLLEMNHLAAAIEATIDATRVLNWRVLALADAEGMKWTVKDE